MAPRTPPPDETDDDDAALFRESIGDVRRIAPAAERPAAPKPRPVAKMAQQDEVDARTEFQRALDVSILAAGDALSYRRDEVSPRVLKRLGRGEFAAEDELDLHGHRSDHAEALLRGFLKTARDAGGGCVRIVHGKGFNSDTPHAPVLKNLVDRVLRQRADVLAFHSAPQAQGGTGAVLVLLAPRRG